MATKPYALQAGEGWKYRYGVDFVVKAGEVRPGGSAAFLEYETRKGEEPGAHMHATEDEMFYVLAGAIRFQCGQETFELAAGGFIFLPCRVEHSYTILGDEAVRLIVVTAPARDAESRGWSGFVADMELGQGELIASPGSVS